MLEWVYWAADQVDELAKVDRDYLEVSMKQEQLVSDFEALLSRLPAEERELILEYMLAEGEMQYRKTQLAYEFSKQVGRKQAKS